jgi:nicotinate-nucleotide pyrophosphorylase (carboxylating)
VQSLNPEEVRRAVQLALAEDVGPGDVTTLATVPETAQFTVIMRAREPLVVAGLALAEATFRELSNQLSIETVARD